MNSAQESSAQDRIESLERDTDQIRAALVTNLEMIEKRVNQTLQDASHVMETVSSLKTSIKNNIENSPIATTIGACFVGFLLGNNFSQKEVSKGM